MKTPLIIIVLMVCFGILSIFSTMRYIEEKQNNSRLNNNFVALATEMNDFKKQSVTTGILEMKLNEVRASFPELEKHIKDEFNVKLRNVLQYQNTQTIINHTFTTTVKDSFKLDTIPIEVMEFSDKWIDFKAIKVNSDFTLEKNITTVPLEQVFFRDKWRPKYILPWKKRPLYQDIKTENPYALIEFHRTINFKK